MKPKTPTTEAMLNRVIEVHNNAARILRHNGHLAVYIEREKLPAKPTMADVRQLTGRAEAIVARLANEVKA